MQPVDSLDSTHEPVVFSHGWPLNADAWDDLLVFVASYGYRAIAHDCRDYERFGAVACFRSGGSWGLSSSSNGYVHLSPI